MATKRSGYALRKFRDEGTKQSFKAGDRITDLDEGIWLNYERAGLVGDKRPGVDADADKTPKTAA